MDLTGVFSDKTEEIACYLLITDYLYLDVFTKYQLVPVGIAKDKFVHAPFAWLERFGELDSGGFELRLQ